MKNNLNFLKKIAVIVGLLLGAYSLSALADWSQPTSNAPICPSGSPGCDAPIHVGMGSQTRQGGLILNAKLGEGYYSSYSLWTVNAPIKAEGGLVIQTCAAANCPGASAETGRMWLVQ